MKKKEEQPQYLDAAAAAGTLAAIISQLVMRVDDLEKKVAALEKGAAYPTVIDAWHPRAKF